MTKHRDLLTGALGALAATVLLGAVPLALRTDGIQFSDGSVQTTAARARKFYLTQTPHDGSEALTACAPGFHMASLWEIFDPSDLRYDTDLGITHDDSGAGPPSTSSGWIRTGYVSDTSAAPGAANCALWTSASAADFGTYAFLDPNWSGTAVRISPWFSFPIECDNSALRVWCVED